MCSLKKNPTKNDVQLHDEHYKDVRVQDELYKYVQLQEEPYKDVQLQDEHYKERENALNIHRNLFFSNKFVHVLWDLISLCIR